jgi:KinB signaling pathway activation protein
MLLTLYLSLVAFVLAASFVTQAFVPGWGAAGTTWGLAPGWQREIGFWNLGMLVVVAAALITRDRRLRLTAACAVVTLNLLFGTNHLLALAARPTAPVHLLGMIENYLGLILGTVAVVVEVRHPRPQLGRPD